ncbi:MAG: AAA family ATPase, partial [Patescibacteria group bacterium]
MAHIISVVNQKGGVGKTTTSVNLGAYLAHLGKFVLIVDLDPQANASSAFGINYRELSGGTYEGMIGTQRVKDLIRQTDHQGLKILPASESLAGAAVELVNEMAREHKLHQALLEVRNDFDYI